MVVRPESIFILNHYRGYILKELIPWSSANKKMVIIYSFIPAQKFRYEIRAERENRILKKPSIKISALTALKQRNPSPYETETNGYTLVNFNVNTDFLVSRQILNFGISVNNIFDTQYFDHLSTLKPLNYYNQGRNISVSLKIPFGIL